MSEKDGFTLQEWLETNPQAYDRHAEFMEKVEPLMSALHEACREHKFPMAVVICHTQKANGDNVVAGCAHQPSPETTPAEIIMSAKVASGSIENVNMIHRADVLRTMRLMPGEMMKRDASTSVH